MAKPSSTVDINALNELNPPPDTKDVKQQTEIVFDKQSVPMAGEWSNYPAILDWNIGFYCYKTGSELHRRACFIMVHSGTTQTIIDDVKLTHKITFVGGDGTFDNHLPATSEENNGDKYQYKINFSEALSLTKQDTNPFTFTAKYGDQFTRRGFVQSGTYDDDKAVFTLTKAPINSSQFGSDRPHTLMFKQNIKALTSFTCDVNSDNKYTFEFSFDTGASPVTKQVELSFPVSPPKSPKD